MKTPKGTLKHVKTAEVSREMVGILEKLIDETYVKGGHTTYKKEILGLLKAEDLSKGDEKEFFSRLKDRLKDAEIITLKVGVSPDKLMIESLYDWFDDAGFKNFLLDFETVPSLYGGCQVIYKGRFLDVSLKTKVKEYVSAQRK